MHAPSWAFLQSWDAPGEPSCFCEWNETRQQLLLWSSIGSSHVGNQKALPPFHDFFSLRTDSPARP